MSPNKRIISEKRLFRNGISSFLNNETVTIQAIRVTLSKLTDKKILNILLVPRWRPSGIPIFSRYVPSSFSLRSKSIRDGIKAVALHCWNKNVSNNRYGELISLIIQLEAEFESN